jgi:hypothetical protein
VNTQNAQILQHMKNCGSVTPYVALKRFGCMRLAARIRDLRDGGHVINSVIVSRNGKRYAAYSLVEGKAKAA